MQSPHTSSSSPPLIGGCSIPEDSSASVRDIGTFCSEQVYELKIARKRKIKKAEDEGKGVEVHDTNPWVEVGD